MSRGPSLLYGPLKRVIDIAFAGGVLIVGSPLWALICAAIRITTGPPAIYRGQVAGKDGVPFNYFKFKTMHMLGSSKERAAAAVYGTTREAKDQTQFKTVVDAW